jgi:hypothetical protein
VTGKSLVGWAETDDDVAWNKWCRDDIFVFFLGTPSLYDSGGSSMKETS